MTVNVKMNWGDARLAFKDLDALQVKILEILQPMIAQGFDNIEGWFILNLKSGIPDLGINLMRGNDKLKVKLFHPQYIRTANGDMETEENFWCTSIDRFESFQEKCEKYEVEAKLNCLVINDELFVECDGRTGSAKSSGKWFDFSEDKLSIVDAIWLGCDRDGNSNR